MHQRFDYGTSYILYEIGEQTLYILLIRNNTKHNNHSKIALDNVIKMAHYLKLRYIRLDCRKRHVKYYENKGFKIEFKDTEWYEMHLSLRAKLSIDAGLGIVESQFSQEMTGAGSLSFR